MYKNLSTSRGDGNFILECLYKNFFRIRTYPPREGTETMIYSVAPARLGFCIRTYPPREGTETEIA